MKRFTSILITLLFPLLLQGQCWFKQSMTDIDDVNLSSDIRSAIKSRSYENAYRFLHDNAFNSRTDVALLIKLTETYDDVLINLKYVNQEFLDANKVHLDLGGHNRYPEAVKIITSDVDYAGKPIENLLDGRIQDFTPKFKEASVDRITIESAPYSDDILFEVKRITRDGGSIELEHPAGTIADYNVIADKVGGSVTNSENLVKDGLEYTRVKITRGATSGGSLDNLFKDYPELLNVLNNNSSFKNSFLSDFASSTPETIKLIGEKPELFDAWLITNKAGLEQSIRSNLNDLEKILGYKKSSGRSSDNIIQEIESSAILSKGSTRSWIDIVPNGGGTSIGKIGDYVVHNDVEVFYRGISAHDYKYLLDNGKLRFTSETFTSPTLEYIEAIGYGGDGHVIKFYLDRGTLKELEKIGVRNDGKDKLMSFYPDMPPVTTVTKWTEKHAMFKTEGTRLGLEQINIGLGKGPAIDIFNANIKAFEVVK